MNLSEEFQAEIRDIIKRLEVLQEIKHPAEQHHFMEAISELRYEVYEDFYK